MFEIDYSSGSKISKLVEQFKKESKSFDKDEFDTILDLLKHHKWDVNSLSSSLKIQWSNDFSNDEKRYLESLIDSDVKEMNATELSEDEMLDRFISIAKLPFHDFGIDRAKVVNIANIIKGNDLY